MFDKTFLSR